MWKLMRCLLKLGFIVFFVAGPLYDEAAAACGQVAPLPPGGLQWPLQGDVVNGYSLNCTTDSGHRGIDINAAPGSAVAAAGSGVIAFVGYTPAEGGGSTISIDHPSGLRSTYLHLTEAVVAKGETVIQGQHLGKLGTAPLHFGLKLTSDGDMYFNPLDFLAAPVAGAPPAEASALQTELQPAPAAPQPQAGLAAGGTVATIPDTTAITANIPVHATVGTAAVAAAAPSTVMFSHGIATLFDQLDFFDPNPVQEPLLALQSRDNSEKMPIPYREQPRADATEEPGGGEVIHNNSSTWIERSRLAAAAAVLLLGGLLASSAASPLKETCRPACN